MKTRLLLLLGLCSLLQACSKHTEIDYRWNIPDGFPPPLVPEDNPMSKAKVALGRMLFYDTALSFNQSTSCASCHQQASAFAHPNIQVNGATGQILRRNSQALVNVAYNGNLTWAHSGISTIEQQILIPMFAENPLELGITGYEQEVLARFSKGTYPELFREAFNQETPNFDLIVKALASFVRALLSFQSDFDRYAYLADDSALSDSAKRGMELFFSEKLECFHCHGGLNFSQSTVHDSQRLNLRPFHNTGMYNVDGKGAYPEADQGLIEVTGEPSDMGKYRAPTLRNVAASAPYMHDGSIGTLKQVIAFYAQGGRGRGKSNPYKSQFIKGFTISEQEKQDLLSFLYSLSDSAFLTNKAFAAPSNHRLEP